MIKNSNFYIGTYTEKEYIGIYQCLLNMESGKMNIVSSIENKNSPTFLALNPNKTHLFSCETIEDTKITSTVSSYKINTDTGELTYINSVSSNGSIPAHITVDSSGNHLLFANYGSGSICSCNINNDGSIGEVISVIQHLGSSMHSTRQCAPHPHSINLDSDNKFAYVADLGTDEIVIYNYDKESGELSYFSSIKINKCEGPRHLAFSKDKKFIYLITEIGNNIYVYKNENNTLIKNQIISSLPSEFEGESYSAEIAISPSGRYLYCSNRGHNSIGTYSIDKDSGKLTLIDHFDCGGKIPRHFSIDKSGRFLLVANQQSGNISSFKIDNTSGRLIDTEYKIDIPNATCIRFS